MFNATLYGNLGRDWETRMTQAGKKVASTSIAVRNGEKTTWVKLLCWNEKSIENLSAYTSKGSPLVVSGRVALSEWESQGKHHAQIEMTVDGFALAGKREEKRQELPSEEDIPF